MLAFLARAVIEAALEAELVQHLGYTKYDPAGRDPGSNSRNGSRSKVVRTVLGPVRIEVPRDRFGTFDPITVGKWQRAVVGLDTVLLPVAARGAPFEATVELLRHAYPSGTPEETLRRIATMTSERLAAWHTRSLAATFTALDVRRSALRDRLGRVAGSPFVRVVGAPVSEVGSPSQPDLLALYAVPGPQATPWLSILGDLKRRGVRGVRVVSGHSDEWAELHRCVGRLWPGAVVSTQARSLAAAR